MKDDNVAIKVIVWSFAIGFGVILSLGIVQIVRLMLGSCS